LSQYNGELGKYEYLKEKVYNVQCDFKRNGYRLPTVNEFTYAYSGWHTWNYSWGRDADSVGKYTWYKDNANNRTHPVASKAPNVFGLYDLAGNVSEWCWDIRYEGDNFRYILGYDFLGKKRIFNKEYYRRWALSTEGDVRHGFRCVRTAR
jgi:formylglycine-generating enzyme required for sulfatase activity